MASRIGLGGLLVIACAACGDGVAGGGDGTHPSVIGPQPQPAQNPTSGIYPDKLTVTPADGGQGVAWSGAPGCAEAMSIVVADLAETAAPQIDSAAADGSFAFSTPGASGDSFLISIVGGVGDLVVVGDAGATVVSDCVVGSAMGATLDAASNTASLVVTNGCTGSLTLTPSLLGASGGGVAVSLVSGAQSAVTVALSATPSAPVVLLLRDGAARLRAAAFVWPPSP